MESFDTHSLISVLLSFLPVVVFLIALILIDSYKLVPLRYVVSSILVGCVVLFLCLWVNQFVVNLLGMEWDSFSRYLAPVIEEVFKALFLIYLIMSKRVGFMVDASIHGFAVGAGFAIVENVHYLRGLSDLSVVTWIVRGFGTAIMHGGVTAIMGILSSYYASRYGSNRFFVYLPGLLLAIMIHAIYNRFDLSPEHSTLVILIVFPLLIAVVYRASEKGTKDWLGVRFDTDAELLEMINTGKTSESRIGEYLESLQSRFPGEVVADMLCMLRLHLELSVRAKGMLLMKKAGFKVKPEPEVEERLRELRYLEKSIGKTGLVAISPILNMSHKEIWEQHMVR